MKTMTNPSAWNLKKTYKILVHVKAHYKRVVKNFGPYFSRRLLLCAHELIKKMKTEPFLILESDMREQHQTPSRFCPWILENRWWKQKTLE